MLRLAFVKYLLLPFTIFFLYVPCLAQLKADFIIDRKEGCTPLAVFFTNTTSGASSTAIYSWDFGNGNTSSLKDAGALFTLEKTYTITLSVTDSNKTSSSTQTIAVYQKPTVDFSASLQKGCVPLPVTLTGNATANGGTISSYFWDFGDGITESGTTSQVTHNYVAQQQPTISLTVTDNHGCQGTLLKQNLVTVLPELVSSFTAEKNVLCTLADAARFINTSTGPGTLSYKWDFGDGGTSVATQPSHVFSVAGIYTIGLTVNSSEGCTVTNSQNNLINAAGFKSSVAVSGTACDNNATIFQNKSTPASDNSLWEFSDGAVYNTIGPDSAIHYFGSPGTYTLKLTNTFGTCTDVYTMPVVVKRSPVLNGFIANLIDSCGSPARINFKDTTATAVQWQWTSSGYSTLQATEQAPSYTFLYDDTYYITLKVTDAAGCTASATKPVSIYKPRVVISSPEDYYGNGIVSCGPKNIHFIVTSSEPIKNYLWDLGDGASSTAADPSHLYSKAGDYYVHLKYTTMSGCTGTADFYYAVSIRDNVKADFSVANPNICGNTPVTFNNLTPYADYYTYIWDFGDGQTGGSYYNQDRNITHQYQDKGIFTITLIATNGICADTIVKKDYIKVAPPFPRLDNFTNACEGTRGEVTFNQSSTQVVSGTWNFGDGATSPYVDQPQIKHTYNKTGFYKVVLTTTNGACTVGDSTFVPVLLKQHPVLAGDKTVLCSRDDYLQLTYSNLEVNPAPYGSAGYGYGSWYHSDGSYAIGHASGGNLDQIPFTMTVYDFTPGAGLWSMVTSGYFGCVDTTNTIPLTIKGPIPGFKQDNADPCGNNNTVVIEDTSKSQFGSALVSWEWNFGDGQTQTYNHGGKISHTYNYPGTYPVYLTVTDASGCHAFYQNYVSTSANTLMASFNASATAISPGTSINFTNTSQTSDLASTTYKWLFGDGTQATTTDAVKTFSVPGTFIVKLIATNTAKGCMDTASVTIIVKFVNAAFTFNASYISGSKCPPVVVSFSNTSSNVSKIVWDFGDGTIVNNVFNPTHVYTKAGLYKVFVTTYSDNGTSYITEDSVIIKEPTALLKTDILHSCTAQSVRLSAVAQNASSYLWDYGDGDIVQSTDSFSVHYYKSAGIYQPHLMVTDANGCAASVSLGDKIIIDSLSVSLKNIPSKICVPKQVFFSPDIVSIAGNQASQNITYHWNFGTGKPGDTSNIKNPFFDYLQTGNYPVSLQVRSVYGCIKDANTSILALQGLGAKISGPPQICQGLTAQFMGSTQLAGQPKWKWIFSDGTTALQQNPPPKEYDNAGNFPVTLVVDNNGCADTVTQTLQVNPKPDVNLSIHESILCEGSSVSITAGGGGTYIWSPATGLDNTSNATVVASPVNNTIYKVAVTNSSGCINKDSVKITVVHPFIMQAEANMNVCSGKSVTLQVSGADTYRWINNTAGLSNISIANPVATPVNTTVYTVTGTDANKCFTDTADIQVTVQPLPVADAGESAVILAGSPYQLQPTTSSDVVKWSWSPSSYLSCTDCKSPVATPAAPQIYTLTVTNAAGCVSSDTVSVKLFCSESRIFIPTAFTPNHDGLNELFSILGEGIRIVHYFRIYDRWGTLVFEHNNFQVGDKKGSWDGRYKGQLVSQGAYVYFTELSCNEETYVRKGSVTVLY